jgi:hypothetical protein
MTGNELAKQIRKTRGKIYAWTSTLNDGLYVAVEKQSLIVWCEGCGDSETGMQIIECGGVNEYRFTQE